MGSGRYEGEEKYYGVDTVFPFAAAFIDRSLSFVERSDKNRMDVLYTKMVNIEDFDHKAETWVDGELVRLRSEIQNFKCVVEKKFAPHCSSGLLRV